VESWSIRDNLSKVGAKAAVCERFAEQSRSDIASCTSCVKNVVAEQGYTLLPGTIYEGMGAQPQCCLRSKYTLH
jgi:hypothetical protein